MAALGQFVVEGVQRRADRWDNFEWLRYDVQAGVTGDETNSAQLLIPEDVLEARLEHCAIYTVQVATAHVIPAYGMCCMLSLYSDVFSGIVSDPCQFCAVGGGTTDGWGTQFPLLMQMNFHVTGGQSLTVHMPPADDNASPTADYDVNLGLRIIRHSKRS